MPKFKLKSVVEKLDEVPEAYRANYEERDGKFYLSEIEIDDAAEVKSALERERNERREAKAALEKLKDVDPEEFRRLKKAEEDKENKKLADKGEFDRLVEKRQAEWDAKESAYKKQVEELGAGLRKFKLDDRVKAAALKAGVIPEDIEDVLTITRPRFDLDDKDRIVVFDADGDPTTLTPDNFFGEVFKTQRPKFYQATGAGGSGAPAGGTQGGGAGQKTVKRADFDRMPPSDQMAHVKAGGAIVD